MSDNLVDRHEDKVVDILAEQAFVCGAPNLARGQILSVGKDSEQQQDLLPRVPSGAGYGRYFFNKKILERVENWLQNGTCTDRAQRKFLQRFKSEGTVSYMTEIDKEGSNMKKAKQKASPQQSSSLVEVTSQLQYQEHVAKGGCRVHTASVVLGFLSGYAAEILQQQLRVKQLV